MSILDFITPGDKEPEPLEIVLLGDKFARAMLGHSVAVNDPPRAVYSLVLLTDIIKTLSKVSTGQAQASVSAMVGRVTKTHGDKAPLFVDDSVSRPTSVHKNRIVTPGGRR